MTVESFDTVAPKIGFALPDAAVELVFNRPLGDAKLARDFGLGKLAEFAEDDDFTATSAKVRRELKQLTDTGVNVYLQRGNRDFLISERFARGTGVVLLDDYTVIELEGQRTLLTHGDLLCSDDLAYQAFRVKSRTQAWQQNVLSKPLWLRLLAARWYRLRSFWYKLKKSSDIMDVNQITVKHIMAQHDCSQLIHGHTHRAGKHEFMLNGVKATRIV
jgi:UDP-2,3-diacylglucosamine hydrolase